MNTVAEKSNIAISTFLSCMQSERWRILKSNSSKILDAREPQEQRKALQDQEQADSIFSRLR
mgnify:CR=1 FL=1